MIPHLTSPAVCVIDDEESDYRPILSALTSLGLGCVHIRGRNGDPLPPRPFDALRVVFTDLHLSGQIGKAAASHTANIVTKVVSASSGPVLLVIWSKYAADLAGDTSLPPEDQPTEADLFKIELLTAEPKFKDRLVFVEMAKPKLPDRPSEEEWIKALQSEIDKILNGFGAFDILWIWEALVRRAGISVSETLTNITASIGDEEPLAEKLKVLLRLLAQQQGGPDSSVATASRHLLTVFSQIESDAIEKASAAASLDAHAAWLADPLDDNVRKKHRSAKLNGMLLTSSVNPMFAPLVPGTVFDVLDAAAMATATGFTLERLQLDCFEGTGKSPQFADFQARTTPVFIEITPACDFHQGHRRCAMMIAGLVFPSDLMKRANSKDACKTTPLFEDRFALQPVDIGFVFCGRYRFTTSLDREPAWMKPRLRLRDLLVADFRNWHSAQASRVGYLSF